MPAIKNHTLKLLVQILCFFVFFPHCLNAQIDKALPQSKINLVNFVQPPLEFNPRPLWFWNNTTVTEAGINDQMQKFLENSGYVGFVILPFLQKFMPK